MTKVRTPLMSFEARGQIAKSVVYFPWKGVNAVREYVVPMNPRTEAQRAQRLHMTHAVAEWHNAAYSAEDVIAWNRYAGVLAKIMAGFNAFCRVFIKEEILTNVWERIHGVYTVNVQATSFEVYVRKAAAGNAPTIYYGTRKTHFPDSIVTTDMGGGIWGKNITGLTTNTLYYFYIEVGTTATDFGRTGIYAQRTS